MEISNLGKKSISEVDTFFEENLNSNFIFEVEVPQGTSNSEIINQSNLIKNLTQFIPFKGGLFGQFLISPDILQQQDISLKDLLQKIFLYIFGQNMSIGAPWDIINIAWSLIKFREINAAAIQVWNMEESNLLKVKFFIPFDISLNSSGYQEFLSFDTLNARIQGALIDAKVY